jgi:hypothetical protein
LRLAGLEVFIILAASTQRESAWHPPTRLLPFILDFRTGLGHDGERPGCPYLEYVDAERCPAVDVKDLPRCEDKCIDDGDYCRGTGPEPEFCGASAAKPQCDGEAVYKVTSTIDMAREGCDDGPGDDGPGFEFDDDGDNCPFPCPARNAECPALEPLPADECPPKEASMADCVGYDCECGSVL